MVITQYNKYTENVLWNYTPKTNTIVLTIVTAMSSTKKFLKRKENAIPQRLTLYNATYITFLKIIKLWKRRTDQWVPGVTEGVEGGGNGCKGQQEPPW